MQRFCRQSALLCSKRASFQSKLNISVPVRFISENSWAAEELKAKGEKLTPRVGEHVIVDNNTLDTPSKEVKELAERYLELNMVEANQFLKIIQVNFVLIFLSYSL